MGEPDEPLIGFSWRRGTKRDTNGVILWSDIFLHEIKNGKKLAIILMDTQGLFDTITSPTDNSRIFALGTLASSIQIFNLNDVIQENQLEYLQVIY
jgi:atlastin